MKKHQSEWNDNYAQMDMREQLFDSSRQSPDNFIDDIKMEYLLPHLPKTGVVLEIGAGSGKLLTRVGINRVNCRLIGIDYVRQSSIIVKENLSLFDLKGDSICGDVFHIPLKNNSVDVVISGGLLEHFNDCVIDNVVKEMIRVLKFDGLFYADIAPKKFSLLRPIILEDVGGYENSFSKKKWYDIFYRNDLRYIDIFSGLVLPPNFYGWFKSGLQLKIMYFLKSVTKWRKNTFWTDVFGFEYFVFARKLICE